MENIFQNISLIFTALIGMLNLLIIISRPFRQWLLRSKEEKAKELAREEEQRETDKCLLRKAITEIYYRRRDTGKIFQYEFELVEQLYAHYKKLGGNSFIDKLWKEIKTWQIIQ